MVPPDDLTKLFLRFIAKREFLSSTNRGAAFLPRSESCTEKGDERKRKKH